MIGNPRHARRTRSRQPRFDSLESRALLAGDVTVQFAHGSAIIVGDSLSNSIQIDQAGLDANGSHSPGPTPPRSTGCPRSW